MDVMPAPAVAATYPVPTTCGGYLRTCADRNLPTATLEAMVTGTCNERIRVRQYAFTRHLLTRTDLTSGQLLRLARALREPHLDQTASLLLTHPKMTADSLILISATVGLGQHMRSALEDLDGIHTRTVALARDLVTAATARPRHTTWPWTDQSLPRFVRTLRLHPGAGDTACRLLPSWTGTLEELLATSVAVTRGPARC